MTGAAARMGLVVFGLLLVLTYLLLRGITPDAARHEQRLRAIDALTFNEAALHRDVLKASHGLLLDYDPLVATVARLREVSRGTRQRGSTAPSDGWHCRGAGQAGSPGRRVQIRPRTAAELARLLLIPERATRRARGANPVGRGDGCRQACQRHVPLRRLAVERCRGCSRLPQRWTSCRCRPCRMTSARTPPRWARMPP